ncbi:macrophage mannose receptor 1-like [Chanos chanos]|uniref:Macrophage mannose receptor 1-like n=1 Tax=Chanos chanos TaxID=29144 RepID=A0A6J2VTX0_CHACN|nr:macrophage mannose receptor 1-like [Chanos chanos]
MSHILHFILLFSGLLKLSACVPRQYHFVNELKTWTEAQTYCREHYTDLATLDSEEDTDELIKAVDTQNSHLAHGHVWIGLRQGDSEKWLWSLTGTHFCRETNFSNWDNGEPNNRGRKEDCVEMLRDGKWNDKKCEVSHAFVCYDENKATGVKYVFIDEPKTWREAQRYCREKHTDLVSVRNQSENSMIKNQVQDTNPVWIGLFRRSWVWSDRSGSMFRNWAEHQPDNIQRENCSVMWVTDNNKEQWGNWPCDKTDTFVCYENELVLINDTLTWSEALNYCREHHVDLVSVHSEKIQKWVMKRVEKASTAHVWLGLRHSCTLGFWFWVSGESHCYENWAPGNRTGVEECERAVRTGAVESGGGKQWVSLPETERLNFICSNYEED